MRHLILYGTSACHLCELADELLLSLALSDDFNVQHSDISDCDDLMARYAIRIPVLCNPATGAELAWPFDATQLRDFLELT